MVHWDIALQLTGQVRQTQQLQLACLIPQRNNYPIMAKLSNQPITRLRDVPPCYDDVILCSQNSQSQAWKMMSSHTIMMSSQNAMQQTHPKGPAKPQPSRQAGELRTSRGAEEGRTSRTTAEHQRRQTEHEAGARARLRITPSRSQTAGNRQDASA